MSEKRSSYYRYKQRSKGDEWTDWYHTYDPSPWGAARRVCYYTYIQAVDDTITVEVKMPEGKRRTFVWELALREA